jgi:hypothetical protein
LQYFFRWNKYNVICVLVRTHVSAEILLHHNISPTPKLFWLEFILKLISEWLLHVTLVQMESEKIHQLYAQPSSRWVPVLRPKTSNTLCESVIGSVIYSETYYNIYSNRFFFLYIMKRCISALQQTNAYYTTLQVLNSLPWIIFYHCRHTNPAWGVNSHSVTVLFAF